MSPTPSEDIAALVERERYVESILAPLRNQIAEMDARARRLDMAFIRLAFRASFAELVADGAEGDVLHALLDAKRVALGDEDRTLVLNAQGEPDEGVTFRDVVLEVLRVKPYLAKQSVRSLLTLPSDPTEQ